LTCLDSLYYYQELAARSLFFSATVNDPGPRLVQKETPAPRHYELRAWLLSHRLPPLPLCFFSHHGAFWSKKAGKRMFVRKKRGEMPAGGLFLLLLLRALTLLGSRKWPNVFLVLVFHSCILGGGPCDDQMCSPLGVPSTLTREPTSTNTIVRAGNINNEMLLWSVFCCYDAS
jgi:hypothetical protein